MNQMMGPASSSSNVVMAFMFGRYEKRPWLWGPRSQRTNSCANSGATSPCQLDLFRIALFTVRQVDYLAATEILMDPTVSAVELLIVTLFAGHLITPPFMATTDIVALRPFFRVISWMTTGCCMAS